MLLKYEELISNYMATLRTELRHFSPGQPFLDMWVPDCDDANSILNLVESALMHPVDHLSLEVGEETLRRIDLDKLLQSLNHLCKVSVKKNGKGVVFDIILSKRGLANIEIMDVPQAYQKKFISIARCGVYDRSLTEMDPWILCKSSWESLVLYLNIAPDFHTVKETGYQGAVTRVSKYLLDQMCLLLLEKPVNECYDHAVVQLEYELRDKTAPRTIPGITTPFNSWEAFKDLTHLVRSAIMEYRKIADYQETKNFYVPKPSQRWLSLQEEERTRELAHYIHEYCEDRNVDSRKIRIGTLVNHIRLIVDVDKNLCGEQPNFLLDLEFYLKNKIERILTLWTPEEFDKNKIRWSEARKATVQGGGDSV